MVDEKVLTKLAAGLMDLMVKHVGDDPELLGMALGCTFWSLMLARNIDEDHAMGFINEAKDIVMREKFHDKDVN